MLTDVCFFCSGLHFPSLLAESVHQLLDSPQSPLDALSSPASLWVREKHTPCLRSRSLQIFAMPQ